MQNLVEFKKDLRTSKPEEVVQKYLFDSSPYCFSENPQLYIEFRREICEQFQIHLQNFAIVGSAKVGFSLNPTKFGVLFSDHSDVDVVPESVKIPQHVQGTSHGLSYERRQAVQRWYKHLHEEGGSLFAEDVYTFLHERVILSEPE